MKRTPLILLFFISISSFYSQESDAQKKEILMKIQKTNYKNSIFNLIHKSWIANDAISNISFLSATAPIKNRRIPLLEGEGKQSNLFLLEANLNLKFPLFFGRRDVGSSFRRLNKLTLDYSTNFRMTLDDSKPLTTPNNDAGISWHLNLWNNYSNWLWNSYYENLESKYIYKKDRIFNFLNLILSSHHYSNGQSGESLIFENQGNMTGETRNNYLNGDFSTNYFYAELTYGYYSKKDFSLNQFSLAYRKDWGLGQTLSFNPTQDNSYGKKRILFKFDHRPSDLKKTKLHYRAEFSYIMDNLENFKANLINDNNKYRFSGKGIIEFTPKSHRSIGYFVSAYYGRDYLNIRYDDIIISVQWGLTLSLDKYFAAD